MKARLAHLIAQSRRPNADHAQLDAEYRSLELDRIEALRVELSSKLVDSMRLRAVAA